MSPFQIKIMLHHYCTTSQPYDGEESATAVASTIQELVKDEMLLFSFPENTSNYKITEKGKAYVEKLMSIPLPVETTVWTFPEDDHDI